MTAPPRTSTRRTFLRRTLWGAALLGVSGTVLRHLTGYALDGERASQLKLLSPKEYLVLQSVARRILDGGAPAVGGGPGEIDVALAADRYLAGLPAHLSSDVRALLQLVEHSPALFDGQLSRFTHLDGAAQDAVLERWQSSRLAVRRQGFVALKSLAMMGYFGDARTFAQLGYGGPLLDGDRERGG